MYKWGNSYRNKKWKRMNLPKANQIVYKRGSESGIKGFSGGEDGSRKKNE
ncbi:hypothetical protein Bca4012_024562 [Brassica carinata]